MSVVHVWDMGLLCRWFHTKGGDEWGADRFMKFVTGIGEGAEHIIMCRDPDRRHTFRHDLFPEYKLKRAENSAKDPEGRALLLAQYEKATRLCEAARIPMVGAEGWEADDVVATVTREAVESGFSVVVFSGDKDMAQLMAPDVTLHDGKEVVTPERIRLRFGVEPEQVVDYLAIAGDTADGVPGVPGLGEVAAKELLKEYTTLECVLSLASGVSNTASSRWRKMRDNADTARLCKRLIVLDDHAPIGQLPWEIGAGACSGG